MKLHFTIFKMHFFRSSRHLITIVILLGIITHSVLSLTRPSVLLKRSILRRRLMTRPFGGLRLKRQLFREDIPHHRPLTGNTYYVHAGFPHPSRWLDGAPQVFPPNPNPITHHHLHKKPALHEDLHNNNLQQQQDHEHPPQHQLTHPPPHQPSQEHHHHNHHQIKQVHHHHPGPVLVSKPPSSVTIQSSIVHANGVLGGVVDNNIVGPPPAPHPPESQVNFDPYIPPPPHPPSPDHGHGLPHPHSEPHDHYHEEHGPPPEDHYDHHHHHHHHEGPISPPKEVHTIPVHHEKQPERKPKTIIHYHPVTVGNIINFNDDQKPITPPSPAISYGPQNHVPGVPLAHKDLLSMAEPFIKTPFKTVPGPDFLDFHKDTHHYGPPPDHFHKELQYGPPDHRPGIPLSELELSPMLPSFGPPIKHDGDEAAYGIALPVLAHLHSTDHHHHHHHHPPPRIPKRHRKGGRSHHHNPRHVHVHHLHHLPAPALPPASPFFDVKHATYVVHGHVPNKLVSMHSPHFRRSHHHHHPHVHPKSSYWGF